ncbi:MAG TPA: Arm DNA-binding domain-containing protein, partial [Methylocella sp.]|nr:Arm DNA-binding domain-containing protein [Methylocella sp.]
MPRQATKLSAAKVRTAGPGKYCDGEVSGLYLMVRSARAKYWLFRYTLRGKKMREMGLGAAVGPRMVSLADAREAARKARSLVAAGIDPLDERAAEKCAAS